nr:MAG TPA: hypothetical protein [Caudoviricetes sp.]
MGNPSTVVDNSIISDLVHLFSTSYYNIRNMSKFFIMVMFTPVKCIRFLLQFMRKYLHSSHERIII